MSARIADGDILALADSVLSRVPDGGDAEVVVEQTDSALTRYALNAIHQNVAESGVRLRLRLVAEGRTGVAEVRGGGDDAAERVVHAAEEARRLAPAREDTAPLPDVRTARAEAQAADSAAWSDATADATPEQRADMVRVVTEHAASHGVQAFGALQTTATHIAVANTRGVRRHARTTMARFIAVVRGDDGAGYADRCAADVSSIDAPSLAGEVVDTALRNQGAAAVDPGDYEVVLSPYAVAEMLDYLAWMGFGALARQEKRSFMRPGEKLMSDSVTIRDDAGDPAGLPFPFDWEGVSTQPVTCVENGVCRDLVYDTPTALVDGVPSTGHALPQPNTTGPVATHLVMAPGEATRDQLVAGVRRGIYVTRFWYVREVHPLRTIITGMTREGTFLVEGGRITRPVRDLRFTQSIVEALDDVRGISRERFLEFPDEGTPTLVPWLHLGRFRFSS